MGLAFVPLYIKYIGIEAYGLIGLFAILQAWLGILDMGMRPTLGREMARFTAGARDSQSIRDLLRTAEMIGIATAVAIAVGVWAVSGWLATDWLRSEKLPVATVAKAFSAMGGVTALSFIENIYLSAITGLQRQVLQNVVASIASTVRSLGAFLLLAWVSPTITAFFLWQGAISLANVIVYGYIVYSTIPLAPRRVRFSPTELVKIWRFASGMLAITILSLLLTQIDKVLLSRFLSLTAFGHYVLAGTVANALYILTGPISVAYYPRFSELAALGDTKKLGAAYHQSAQMVTVLIGAVAFVLIAFSHTVLRLWTRDEGLTIHVESLMVVLVTGTMIHGLMWIPFHLQLAYGWTALSIKVNIVAVIVLLPGLWLAVVRFGAIGAASVWVLLNVGYLIFHIHFMHRRLLPDEKWRWYCQDVALPIAAAGTTAFLCRYMVPKSPGLLASFVYLLASAASVLVATVLAAPLVRQQVGRHLPENIRSFVSRSLDRAKRLS